MLSPNLKAKKEKKKERKQPHQNILEEPIYLKEIKTKRTQVQHHQMRNRIYLPY